MSASVLIVQPDGEVAERLGQLILEGVPDAQVGFLQRAQDALATLDNYEDLDLCVCEVYFEDGDGLAFLAAVRTRFRRARVLIVTRYDLTNFADYIQGLTLFTLPLDEELFRITCRDALDTLEGQEFPPFRIGKKHPPDRWGDCYAAYDTGVKRNVFITVMYAGVTPDASHHFRNSATAMARAGHPNVQAVYQAGSAHGRDFFAREKWDVPSLAEMVTAGQRIDGRLAAKIVHVVGSVIIFWDAGGHPHTPIGAMDVSVSPQGVIKVANCVDPMQEATPPGAADLTGLARALQALLAPIEEAPPRVQTLVAKLAAGPVPVAQIVGEAQALDIELAPEREIAVTEEKQQAIAAMAVARKKQKFHYALIAAGAALFVLVAGYFVYARFFAPPPSRAFKEMAAIPAGPYLYQGDLTTMDHAYYIDRYEVTLGQYLKFLIAVQNAKGDAAWRSPLQAKPDKNHEPTDWADHDEDGQRVSGIFTCIRYHQLYHKEAITLDYPVFNIDWYDAYAYAKWAGKRLPTEHEWEKAACGDKGFLYPWGNTFQSFANTWVKATEPDPDQIVSHTQLTVDQNPQDRSPYGVYNMEGNVSEWTNDMAPSTRLHSVQVGVIRGGNFLTTRSADDAKLQHRITVYVPESRYVWLGFRCASDTPPAP